MLTLTIINEREVRKRNEHVSPRSASWMSGEIEEKIMPWFPDLSRFLTHPRSFWFSLSLHVGTLKWSLSKEQWKRRRKRIAIQIKYKALCFVWRTWILFPFNWWFNTKLQAFSFCSPGFPGFSSSCAWIFQGINWKEGGKKKKITELLQSLRVMSVRIEVEIQHETESETWNVFFSFQSLCLYFFSLPFKRIIIVSEGGFFSRTFPKGLCFACLWFYLLSLLFLYLEPWIKTIENRELLFPPLDRLDCHD